MVQMNDLCTKGTLSCPIRDQYLCGCDAAVAHVWAAVGVGPEPLRGEVLSLLEAFDDVLVEPVAPSSLTLSQ